MVDIMLLLANQGFPISVEQVSESIGVRPAREGETLLKAAPGLDEAGETEKGSPPSPGASEKGRSGPGNVKKQKPRKGFSVALAMDRGIAEKGAGIYGSELAVEPEDAPWDVLDIDVEPEGVIQDSEISKHVARKSLLYRPAPMSRVTVKLGPIKSNRLKRFASASRRIAFDYTNLRGQDRRYKIEPYSYRYRRGFVYLYGYDPVDRTIKSFFVHKIRNIQGAEIFNPRWVVEIAD
jgi:hypothetical protein